MNHEENMYATLTGWVSILCWIVVFTPQIYENWKNKTGESLSLWFLSIWLLGDVFNIIGIIMENLLFTMLLLAIYYTLADAFLIFQVFHYRGTNAENDPLLPFSNVDDEEETVPADCWLFSRLLWFSIVGIIIFALLSGFIIPLVGFAQYTGWCSAILYIGSRIPQIVKNAQEQSVEGLSLAMFMFGVAGNATYCLSIFLQSTEMDYIRLNLPWLVGSGGTMIFDIIIGFQFLCYRNRNRT